MNLRINNQEDFWSGILFIGLGILAVIIASDYPAGTATRMGPGYFPTYIGYALIIIGLLTLAISLKTQGQGIGRFAWRPMILLSLGFFAFGWLIDRYGFFAALASLTLLASLAGREFKVMQTIILIISLLAGCWVLFIWGLDLPFPLWSR